MNISEQTKKSILKSVLNSADELNELRRSILLDEDFIYLDARNMDENRELIEVKANKKVDLDDYPTKIGNFGNSRDEMVSKLAMKNRKTHQMEIHNQIRTAIMNCDACLDVNQLINKIKKYESKVHFDGDGHPYNLDKVVAMVYKDYGEELIQR